MGRFRWGRKEKENKLAIELDRETDRRQDRVFLCTNYIFDYHIANKFDNLVHTFYKSVNLNVNKNFIFSEEKLVLITYNLVFSASLKNSYWQPKTLLIPWPSSCLTM